MASTAEQLNNAIYSLASLNPSNPVASNLNNSWQAWFTNARNLLPDVAWFHAFNGFWIAYAAARATAANTSERTPPAMDINPSLWKSITDEAASRGEALKDAGRATGEAAAAAGQWVADAAKPVLFVTALVAVALILSKWRK